MKKTISALIITLSLILLTIAAVTFVSINILYGTNNTFVSAFLTLDSFSYRNIIHFIFGFFVFGGIFGAINHFTKNTNLNILRSAAILSSIFVSLFICLTFIAPMQADDVGTTSVSFFINENYHTWFRNNVSLSLLYKLIYSLWGFGSYYIFILLNLISCSAITYLIPKFTYLVSRNVKAERLAVIFSFFFFPLFALTSFLYNDLLSISLALASLYLIFAFLEHKKPWQLLISIIFMCIACILRMNMFIIAIGIAIAIFYHILEHKNYKLIAVLILFPAIVLSSYISVTKYWAVKYDYDTRPQKPTTEYLAMALQNEESMAGYEFSIPGAWNAIDDKIEDWAQAEHPDWGEKEVYDHPDVYNDYFKREIALRLTQYAQNPLLALKTFITRTGYTWGDSQFESTNHLLWNEILKKEYIAEYRDAYLAWSNVNDFGGRYEFNEKYGEDNSVFENKIGNELLHGFTSQIILWGITKPFATIVYLGALLFVILNRKKLNVYTLTCLSIFCGYFMFHEFIWETRTRYILPAFILLIPLAISWLQTVVSPTQFTTTSPKKIFANLK